MMSSSKQEMLQSLLRDGFAAAGSVSSSKAPTPLDPDLLKGIEERLLPMGFSQKQVQQAALALSGRAAVRATGSVSASEVAAEQALDWLFIHLPSDQMPRQYRTGDTGVDACHEGKAIFQGQCGSEDSNLCAFPEVILKFVLAATSTVAVISNSRTRDAEYSRGNEALESVPSPEAVEDREVLMDSVLQLGSFGYTPSECSGALAKSQGNQLVALQELYHGLTGRFFWPLSSFVSVIIFVTTIQAAFALHPTLRLQGHCSWP